MTSFAMFDFAQTYGALCICPAVFFAAIRPLTSPFLARAPTLPKFEYFIDDNVHNTYFTSYMTQIAKWFGLGTQKRAHYGVLTYL